MAPLTPPWVEEDEASTAVHYLVTRGRELMLEHFTADSCVASCRVGRDLLRAFGLDAKAVQVTLTVINATLAAALDEGRAVTEAEGAWSVSMGAEAEPGDKRHPLHVVLLVGGDGLLDPSLDQAARPARGIDVGPSFFPWPTEEGRQAFADGGRAGWKRQDGTVITYQLRSDRFFENSPNWGRRDRALVGRMVGRMVREIRAGRATVPAAGEEADDGRVH